MQRTLLHGGSVVTQNETRDVHEALVLEGDRILATGSLDDMKSAAGEKARRIDLQGATVMPGVIDNHAHKMHFGATDALAVNLYDARDHADIFQRIRERVGKVQPGQWITTTPVGDKHYYLRRSWRDLPEGRLPNRYELDAVAPNNPVMIQATPPQVPNVCAMNSMAMQIAGFSRDMPDCIGDVTPQRDAAGELTGHFVGSVNSYYNASSFWREAVSSKMRPPADFRYIGGLYGQAEAARFGITALYEGHSMEAEHIAAYQRIRDEGKLTVRVLAALEAASVARDAGASLTDESVRANFALAAQLKQVTDHLFRVNGLTMSPCGAAWPGFMRTEVPYKDGYGRDTNGITTIPPHLDREALEYCYNNDIRLNRIHGSSVEHKEFFEWIEALSKDVIRSRDWVIQHNIFIDEESIQRMADLNLQLTTTASFCWGKGDMYAQRLGEEALQQLLPIGKLFASGANVGLGSDWGPLSPFEHMAVAQTRKFGGSGRRHNVPGFEISRQQALDGWTRNNARLMNWDDIGSLQPGFQADLAIVDRNPLSCSIEELPGTQVLRTVLGGVDTYDAKIFPRLDDRDLPPERVDSGGLAEAWRRTGKHVCGTTCGH